MMQLDREAGSSRRRLVILVHGEERGRLVCRTALSQAGFEVITATDAETALLVAGFTSPDVILLDVDLPALSSLVRARDIRPDCRRHDAQIVALTHELEANEQVEPHATRFDQILRKPADEQTLLEAVGGGLVPA